MSLESVSLQERAVVPNAPRTVTRLALVTDAWTPQVNGVVTTLVTTVATLRASGVQVEVIHPGLFKNFPCPSYPEIRVAWRPAQHVNAILRQFQPDAIHVATEGPLGYTARRWCMTQRLPFTTAYHTQFPEYLAKRLPVPVSVTYAWLRHFHGAAARTMVATPAMQQQLEARGFKNIVRWSRGVDTSLFKPYDKALLDLPRPVMAYAGRVAVEKNLEAFLKLELPGTKLVIGGGPALAVLRSRYPQARFVDYQFGEALARHIALADVFVFPSLTDTFGLVMLEAMACGVPVAAFPVTGPVDVITQGVNGFMDKDLGVAIKAALQMERSACRSHAMRFSWQAATQQFADNLARIDAQVW